MSNEQDFEFTEAMFDKAAPVLGTLIGLTALESQLDALTDIGTDLRAAVAAWVPEMRDRAAGDLRQLVQQVRDVLDRVESALPEQSA